MDHFRNFQGFGNEGDYVSCSREDPVAVAEEFLSQHRGKRVELRYNEISREYKPEFKYNQRGMFTPHCYAINVPTNGNLRGILKGVLTDNIEIDLGDKTLEIQRIVVGNQWISEVRQHNWSSMDK